MSFTAYRTWVANDVLSAAQLNEQVRDNGNLTPAALFTAAGDTLVASAAHAPVRVPAVYKTADESVNNSTTLQNDDHLLFAIGANEVWSFRMLCYITVASGSPGWKQLFTFPSGCAGWYQSLYYGGGVIDAGFATTNIDIAHTAIGTTLASGLPGASALMLHNGVLVNGSTAGTIQFQWAQSSAVASNLTLKKGSYMDIKRLA